LSYGRLKTNFLGRRSNYEGRLKSSWTGGRCCYAEGGIIAEQRLTAASPRSFQTALIVT